MHTLVVQMKGGKVAISGWTKNRSGSSSGSEISLIDLIVLDLVSGEKILSARECLQLNRNVTSALEKERLLFTSSSGALPNGC